MSGSGRIDWSAVRRRMAEAEALIGRSLEPDPARIAELLRQRAARLAERRAAATAAPTVRVLSFWLGEELCALEITAVAEVLPYQRCTPVPGQAAELLGVVNLRGRIRPVLDLAALTGSKGADGKGAALEGGYILFLRASGGDPGAGELGARVDRVDAVRNIRLDELADAGRGSGQLASRFARGITGDSLILLDTEAIQATLANVIVPAS